jgi:hypothetical protein
MPHSHPLTAAAAGLLFALAVPVIATAQHTPSAGAVPSPREVASLQPTKGPAFGFGMKYVDVGGQSGLFTDMSGGYEFGGQFFVGAGAYMRVDRAYPRRDMSCSWELVIVVPVVNCSEQVVNESGDFYGGLLLRWRPLLTGRVSIGAGGLVGAGLVKIGWDGAKTVVTPASSTPGNATSADGLYDQMYLVVEPQMDVAVAVNRYVTLTGGIGYRTIGAADGLEKHLGGMTASLAVHLRTFR